MCSWTGQLDTVFAPSEYYRTQLGGKGFDMRKIRILARGVDLKHFKPEKRDSDFPRRFAEDDEFLFLYVGPGLRRIRGHPSGPLP